MTEDDSLDSRWLAAMADRPDPGADRMLNAEAATLRRALQSSATGLDATVPAADENLFSEIQARLHREGLLRAVPARPDTKMLRSGVALRPGFFANSAKWLSNSLRMGTTGSRLVPALGLAAIGAIGLTVVIQITRIPSVDSDADVMRGSAGATVLIVKDPQARLEDLQMGLRAAGEEPRVARSAKGQITLKVMATSGVLDYLRSQRIEPMVKDGQVVLRIEPETSKP